VGYDDSDKRIPNMTIINWQLGINSYLLLYIYIYILKPWDTKTSL
jgi:hypothetical protein